MLTNIEEEKQLLAYSNRKFPLNKECKHKYHINKRIYIFRQQKLNWYPDLIKDIMKLIIQWKHHTLIIRTEITENESLFSKRTKEKLT